MAESDRLTDAELAELERQVNHATDAGLICVLMDTGDIAALLATASRESEQAKRIERLERAMRIAVASHTLGCPCDLCQIIKEPPDADA